MSKNDKTVVVPNDDQLDAEIKALLEDAAETTLIDASVAANDEEVNLEDVEAEAIQAETRKQAYAEQEGEAASEDATVTPITAAKKSRSPRISRAAGAKPSDVLASVMDEEGLLKAAMLVNGDPEDSTLVDQLNSTINNLAKKVGDKAVNLLRHKSEPKKLQNYTRIGLELLQAEGGFNSKRLTAHFQEKGYSLGTSRSQANQIMALFPALKVCERSGKDLVVNDKSAIAIAFHDATLA